MYNLDHIKNTTLIVGGQGSSSPYNVYIYNYTTGNVHKELSGGHTNVIYNVAYIDQVNNKFNINTTIFHKE